MPANSPELLKDSVEMAKDAAEQAEQSSTDTVVVEFVKAGQANEVHDRLGAFGGAEKVVIATPSGTMEEGRETEQFRAVRQRLRDGAKVFININAGDIDETQAAMESEARLNKEQNGKGQLVAADMKSDQKKQFDEQVQHLGIESETDQTTFNAVATRKEEEVETSDEEVKMPA